MNNQTISSVAPPLLIHKSSKRPGEPHVDQKHATLEEYIIKKVWV